MRDEGGVYTIPCSVNGLKLRFIFDTGASDVCMSLSEAVFMLKNGYLIESDFVGLSKSMVADGRIAENTKIILREIVIGNRTLYNVKASIMHEIDAPLLLGQTAIRMLGNFKIENGYLIFNENKQRNDHNNPSRQTDVPRRRDYDELFSKDVPKFKEEVREHPKYNSNKTEPTIRSNPKSINVPEYSSSYLAYTTGEVNMRPSPTTKSSILRRLPSKRILFVISSTLFNEFYNVIDIETDQEGYVHKNYITLHERVPLKDGGLFTPVKTNTGKTNSPINVHNNTSKKLTLKANDKTYTFAPNEKRIVVFSPGKYSCRASAPGVYPWVGTESIASGNEYSWTFYITTTQR